MLYQAKKKGNNLNIWSCLGVIQKNLDTEFKAAILSMMPNASMCAGKSISQEWCCLCSVACFSFASLRPFSYKFNRHLSNWIYFQINSHKWNFTMVTRLNCLHSVFSFVPWNLLFTKNYQIINFLKSPLLFFCSWTPSVNKRNLEKNPYLSQIWFHTSQYHAFDLLLIFVPMMSHK